MRDVGNIFAELKNHPDVIECVVWTREDLQIHVEDLIYDDLVVTATVDDIMSVIDMRGWEACAIQDGWETIYQQVQEHGNIEERLA